MHDPKLQDRINAAGARSVAATRAWRLDRGLDDPKTKNPDPDAAVTAEYYAARDAYRAALVAAGYGRFAKEKSVDAFEKF